MLEEGEGPPEGEEGGPPIGPDGEPLPPEGEEGGPPVGPDGEPLPPGEGGPPLGPDGEPLPPGEGGPPLGPDGEPLPPGEGGPPLGPDGEPLPPGEVVQLVWSSGPSPEQDAAAREAFDQAIADGLSEGSDGTLSCEAAGLPVPPGGWPRGTECPVGLEILVQADRWTFTEQDAAARKLLKPL